jgi:endonuclease-3
MTIAKQKERTERIEKLDAQLKLLFPDARIELKYKTPWQLLVAVQLSAQCTDRMVNKITEKLFKRYKTLEDYVEAGKTPEGIAEFAQMVRASGYFNAKTKNILAAAKMVQEEFGGVVPKTIEELLRIPGVARKTATVVLSEAYKVIAGITVDTHVIRFVHRFDLSDHKDPVRIEKDLTELLPDKSQWPKFTHRVIHYGRYLAPARVYDTSKDPLVKVYPPAGRKFRVIGK